MPNQHQRYHVWQLRAQLYNVLCDWNEAPTSRDGTASEKLAYAQRGFSMDIILPFIALES